MTSEQKQARKYFDGVLMAYQDCAEFAEKIAAQQAGFAKIAIEGGVSKHDAEIASASAVTVARQLAQVSERSGRLSRRWLSKWLCREAK